MGSKRSTCPKFERSKSRGWEPSGLKTWRLPLRRSDEVVTRGPTSDFLSEEIRCPQGGVAREPFLLDNGLVATSSPYLHDL
jgi:hypothetical protein